MKIAVVGAGIAGLRAAQLLEKAGHQVTVFEAQDRVGGRMLTVDSPGGGYYEAGGEWIDADHHRVIDLLSEYELSPSQSRQWPGLVVHQGNIYQEDSLSELMEADAEAVHDVAVEKCQEIGEYPWTRPELASLDQTSLGHFLDINASDQSGRWWLEAVQRSDEGEDTAKVGLLGWFVGYRHYLAREAGDMSLYRIPGGGGRLCEKMASKLRDLRLRQPLRKVSQSSDLVTLGFDKATEEFEKVVVTLPPPALRDIDWEGIPTDKRAAWDLIGSARAIKVVMRFRCRFWDDMDWNGRILADLPFQQIWDGGQEGAPILSAYICGDAADRIRNHPDPVGVCARALGEVIAEANQEFADGTLYDWVGSPWSQGAFASLAVGSVFGALPYLAKPWGSVHFAGESTATWLGFIEGALESAERVARELQS